MGDVVRRATRTILRTTYNTRPPARRRTGRYRMGDVVKVIGFDGGCPVVEFAYRKGQFLNARGEKTSEKDFYSALRAAEARWPGVHLVDYTCVEHALVADDRRPRYHVFLELAPGSGVPDGAVLDDELCSVNPIYALFRRKNMVQPVSVITVPTGTFARLRELLLSDAGVASSQLKVPRVLRHPRLVEWLLSQKG